MKKRVSIPESGWGSGLPLVGEGGLVGRVRLLVEVVPELGRHGMGRLPHARDLEAKREEKCKKRRKKNKVEGTGVG